MRKQKDYRLFVYHKCQFPEIAAGFQATIRQSNIDEALAVTQKAFGDKQPPPSLSDVSMSVQPVVAEEKYD